MEKSTNQKGGLRVPIGILKENLMKAIKDKEILEREQLQSQNQSWGG